MLEIDIDVGRFVPLCRNEPLEQQAAAYGIDAGDAEHIAHSGVGSGTASLAEDVLRSREANDVVHRQKIRGVCELGDQHELVPELRGDIIRHALWKALHGALPGQLLQSLLRREGRIL